MIVTEHRLSIQNKLKVRTVTEVYHGNGCEFLYGRNSSSESWQDASDRKEDYIVKALYVCGEEGTGKGVTLGFGFTLTCFCVG